MDPVDPPPMSVDIRRVQQMEQAAVRPLSKAKIARFTSLTDQVVAHGEGLLSLLRQITEGASMTADRVPWLQEMDTYYGYVSAVWAGIKKLGVNPVNAALAMYNKGKHFITNDTLGSGNMTAAEFRQTILDIHQFTGRLLEDKTVLNSRGETVTEIHQLQQYSIAYTSYGRFIKDNVLTSSAVAIADSDWHVELLAKLEHCLTPQQSPPQHQPEA